MPICEFCDETFFKDPHWTTNNSERKTHHSHSEEWVKSLHAACTICTLLASKAQDIWYGHSACTNPISVGIDSDIQALRSMEQSIGMPLFDGTLLKLSDADGFLITFRPSNAEAVTTPQNNRELGISLCGCQSFNICPIDQRKIDPVATKVALEQTSTSMPVFEPLVWPNYNSQQPGATPSLDTQARRWVLQCDAHHVTCRAAGSEHSQNSQLPARLIAIDKENFTRVQLIDTTMDPVSGPYTTLRYIAQQGLTLCISG